MMYKHSRPPGYCSGYPGDIKTCPCGVALSVPPQVCGSVFQEALKPFLSTEASVLNLIIMKFDPETKDLLVKSCFPERVAKFTEVSSVLPPTRIWTVSKVFSVSNSWN